ncbi:MAG: creatininase family protein [Aggregatilineales bacterium]
MQISNMNWMQVEAYLQRDNRCILPVGSTEQHAYLSLSVDSILSSKLAQDAGEKASVPVFPGVSYGLAQQWMAYPGTVTLRIETYLALIRDIIESLHQTGFRRILIVNGHGGNSPAAGLLKEWVKWHNWWNAPQVWQQIQATDANGSHASWMENFPWTRLHDVIMPDAQKPMANMAKMDVLNPSATRDYLEDGNMGGVYQRPDAEMQTIWDIAIAETSQLLEEWA